MTPSSCSRSMPWESIEITPVAAAIRSNQTSPRANVMRSSAFSLMSSLSISLPVELDATFLDDQWLVLWTLDVRSNPDLLVARVVPRAVGLLTPVSIDHPLMAVLDPGTVALVLHAVPVAAQAQHLDGLDALFALALAASLPGQRLGRHDKLTHEAPEALDVSVDRRCLLAVLVRYLVTAGIDQNGIRHVLAEH